MYLPNISQDCYTTPEERVIRFRKRRLFKGAFWFYARYSLLVIWSGLKFLVTRDPQKAVTLQALRVMRIAEKQGVILNFEGLSNYPANGGPYVFACNHMGTFDVNSLPGLVASRLRMTFVVKKSLLKTPFFGQVLKRLHAIPIVRKKPGEDLMQVLNEGTRRIEAGMSVILFPESTRHTVFTYSRFNSIAMKLAVKTGVAVVPVALRTDFWGIGRYFKDYGQLKPATPCHIAFGKPIHPTGRGKKEHREVLDFIAGKLESWGIEVHRDTDMEQSN